MSEQDSPETAPTIPRFLRALGQSYGDAAAIIHGDDAIGYRELEERSARLAARLLGRGVGKGTRIGILFGNGIDWVVWWAAITRIGAVAVTLSTFGRPGELARTIRHADLHGLVMTGEHLGRSIVADLESAFPALRQQKFGAIRIVEAPYLRWVVVDEIGRPSWAADADWLSRDPVSAELRSRAEAEVHVDDPATIIYTSGAAAEPKGVVHTHGAIMSKTHYLRRMFDKPNGGEMVADMPFFWVGGLAFSLLTTLECGGLVDCRSKSAFGAAAPLGSAGKRENPLAHLRHFPSLGMSETFGMYGWGTTHQVEDYPIAAPIDIVEPGYDVRVVDAELRSVPEGVVGEIIVRGPTVTGQLVKVDRRAVFGPDGHYRTGDQGVREGERIYFVGRMGDMIKTSGANVAPAEVEQELLALDGVEAAFVTGVDDPRRGQVVAAAVIAAEGRLLDLESLRAQLGERLSAYKVPKRFVVTTWEALPRTPSQKVDRRRLVEQIAASLTLEE